MQTQLPKMDMDLSKTETGCCPKFDPQPWENKEFVFENKLFARINTINFMHIPLNMGSAITKAWKLIEDSNASTGEYFLLSYDPSPWKGAHYFAVTKDVPGLEMETISGTFLTKVFEGPFKDAKRWVSETEEYVKNQQRELKKLYFFYTTCPKCAKHYGKNYVVAFAQVN
jgi:hypothetical protein